MEGEGEVGAQDELEDSSEAGLRAKMRDHYRVNRPEDSEYRLKIDRKTVGRWESSAATP